jgi:hypothetical protein
LLLIFQTCIGQTEKAEDYKLLFKTADSLNKISNNFSFDSSMLIKLHQLDNQSPASYFEESLHLFDENQYDKAAVFFYIGIIRHQYYISTNPNYAPNDDWVMAESMKAGYVKKFVFVLKTNIEKYILVLQLATDYCQKNDFYLSPMQKNIEKYNFQIDALKKLISDYTNNMDAYIKEWSEERKTLLSK